MIFHISVRIVIVHLALKIVNCTLMIINCTDRRGSGGRDRMVVGFTTTYAISAYQH